MSSKVKEIEFIIPFLSIFWQTRRVGFNDAASQIKVHYVGDFPH